MSVELKPGQHAIRLFMTGYDNRGQWVTVESGAKLNITATMTKSN